MLRVRRPLADRERSQIAAILQPFLIDARHSTHPRSLIGPRRQNLKLAPRPLGHYLDVAVDQVPHPSAQAKRARFVRGRLAKKHALHAPVHEHPEPGKVRTSHWPIACALTALAPSEHRQQRLLVDRFDSEFRSFTQL